MSTVVEGLVVAIQSMPKEDKVKVINLLWHADADVRGVIVDLVVEKLAQSGESHKDSDSFGKNRGRIDLTLGRRGREEGKQSRKSYLSELGNKGISIIRVDNIWAKTQAGLWVAIPFASERNPNRWFLGLPEEKTLDRIRNKGLVIILLCQSASGTLLDFVLPPREVQNIVSKLSKSKGQLKFNVAKRDDNRYYLLLTGHEPLDISDYQSRPSIL